MSAVGRLLNGGASLASHVELQPQAHSVRFFSEGVHKNEVGLSQDRTYPRAPSAGSRQDAGFGPSEKG